MELSIKKASDLAKAALEAANKIKINKSIRITVYGDPNPDNLINEAYEKAVQRAKELIELINIHYKIKQKIGQANDVVGITSLLRESARLETLIKNMTAHIKALEPADGTT